MIRLHKLYVACNSFYYFNCFRGFSCTGINTAHTYIHTPPALILYFFSALISFFSLPRQLCILFRTGINWCRTSRRNPSTWHRRSHQEQARSVPPHCYQNERHCHPAPRNAPHGLGENHNPRLHNCRPRTAQQIWRSNLYQQQGRRGEAWNIRSQEHRLVDDGLSGNGPARWNHSNKTSTISNCQCLQTTIAEVQRCNAFTTSTPMCPSRGLQCAQHWMWLQRRRWGRGIPIGLVHQQLPSSVVQPKGTTILPLSKMAHRQQPGPCFLQRHYAIGAAEKDPGQISEISTSPIRHSPRSDHPSS